MPRFRLRTRAIGLHAGADCRGLTLIELVVVIIVLGLLVGLVGPQVFSFLTQANDTAAKTQMSLLSTALDNYRLDNGAYPTTVEGLAALRAKPASARNWRGPYLRRDVPLDPWDRPYVYRSPGARNPTGFDLMTLGRDGKEGGAGEDADLTSE